ncbi:MAG: uracil-DNA glycosylase [Proteobacteria bacterium]|nr:uracil-DNA glycosylase [Pseudomonadota bacterium]
MTPSPAPDPRALESLLAFWRDAGVAELTDDQPHDRTLEAAERLRAKAPPPDAVAPAVLPPAGPDVAEGAARAREAALACESLDALAAAIGAFDGSTLRRGSRAAVSFRGPPNAAVMVVGEAPGADDEAAGRPFAGRAGALLDRALAAAGLGERALLTHTVFWRPAGDRAPTADEQAVLEPFLDRAIGLVRPQALLLLGAGPVRSLLRQEGGILGLRGRWFERAADDGASVTPALASLSPGFLLRQPRSKKLFWADLLALAARLEGEPEG